MAGLRICGLLMAMALAANWPGSDWVGQAWADDAPPLLPTRDVVVTYKQVGHGGARDIKISQRAQSSVMRVETSGQPGYVLVDRQSQRSTAVMEAQGYYLEMSANRVPQEGQWPDDKISFTRGKDDMVAGQGCTNWDYKTARGNGTACVTADGVLLRILALSGNGLEASQISYETQSPSRFTAPSWLRKLGSSAPPMASAAHGPPPPGQPAPARMAGAAPSPANAAPPPAAGPITLPGGITLPPGVTLPPGLKIPPNLKLPPGFKLPPGVQLPPGVTLPQQ